MNSKNISDVDAEIARMVDGMDFSDTPAAKPEGPTAPVLHRGTKSKDGTVVVYGTSWGNWSELGVQGFAASPEEAINAALDSHHTKYKAVGETDKWIWLGMDEYIRSANGSDCTVKRIGMGWMAEVRKHSAKGWFDSPEAAMAAFDKDQISGPRSNKGATSDSLDDVDFDD
jgi:hypothetical protein